MYIPLNIKTDYSLLSSLIKIEDLVKYAKNLNLKAIGISDDNLCYVMEFYKECIKNDIKPIIGLRIKIEEKDVYLYAKDYKGYQNLCYISSNDIDLELIKNNSEGLFCVLKKDSLDLYNKLNIPDTYIGYNDEKIGDYKNIYFNEIRCFNKEDEEYLKYLDFIKEGKSINDEVIGINNVYFKKVDIDKNEKDIFDEIYNLVDLKIIKNDLLPRFNKEKDFDQDEYLEKLSYLEESIINWLTNFFSTITVSYSLPLDL